MKARSRPTPQRAWWLLAFLYHCGTTPPDAGRCVDACNEAVDDRATSNDSPGSEPMDAMAPIEEDVPAFDRRTEPDFGAEASVDVPRMEDLPPLLDHSEEAATDVLEEVRADTVVDTGMCAPGEFPVRRASDNTVYCTRRCTGDSDCSLRICDPLADGTLACIDEGCPAGQLKIRTSTGGLTCVAVCSRNTDCPSQQCVALTSGRRSVCLPCGGMMEPACPSFCTDDTQCPNGLCEPTPSGQRSCTSDCGPGQLRVGTPGGGTRCATVCTADYQCPTAECTGLVGSTRRVCVACDSTETLCSGRCVNIQVNRYHCGACGRVCAEGQACVSGTCTPSRDPCLGVPTVGVCSGERTLQRCRQAIGETASLATQQCRVGDACVSQRGIPVCAMVVPCYERETRCAGTNIEQCQSGRWVSVPCTRGCLSSPLGATCAAELATVERTGVLSYEFRSPNAARTAWDTLRTAPAGNLAVLALHNGTLVAVSTVRPDGSYRIAVPAMPGAMDQLVFVAARQSVDGVLRLAVVDPRLGAGTFDPSQPVPDQGRIWSWSLPLSSFPADGRSTIPDTAFSAAVHAFEATNLIATRAQMLNGREGQSLIAYLAPGTEWTCGGCFSEATIPAFGTNVESRIVLSGNTTAQEYWSDSVWAHEMGHWWQTSFGSQVTEAGNHYPGVRVLPGMAFSEGWATFVSVEQRADPIITLTSPTSFFWFDVQNRTYSNRTPWPRPVASSPLTQPMDENELAALLLQLSRVDRSAVYRGIFSRNVTVLPAPRGYTTHRWNYSPTFELIDVVDLGTSTFFFADYLDGLNCAGFPREQLRTILEPTTRFPYPVEAPLCP